MTDAHGAPSWQLHCDGSAVPNPGSMGIGAVLVAPDGTRHTVSERLPHTGCNNEAELQALITGLVLARHLGVTTLAAYTDSHLIACQLGATAKRADPARLHAAMAHARTLQATFQELTLTWVPRHRNEEADALARAALGMPPKPAVRPTGRRKIRR